MKLVVFGANGRVGNPFTQLALTKGHIVTAFVRNKTKISYTHPLLTIIEGDFTNQKEVEGAIESVEAVIICVGDRNLHGRITLMSKGTSNLLLSMDARGIKRLIALGGTGILQHDADKLIRDMPGFPEFLKNVSEDHLRVFNMLRESSLDWTLVCPPQIVNSGPTGNFKTMSDFFPDGGNTITTGDIAAFILDELKQNRFLRRRVGITN